jgi:hypothetical protein
MLLELLMAVAIAETPDRARPLLECPAEPTGSWVVVQDHRRALAFVATVRRSPIEMSEGRPFDCGLQLLALCVPDLDADGVPDLVVRAGWGERYSNDPDDSDREQFARCHDPKFIGPSSSYTSIFVVLSAGAPSPSGVVRLLHDETGSGREGMLDPSGPVWATRWRGQPALKIIRRFSSSSAEITKRQEDVVVVRRGRLVVVRERQLEPTR